jgi:hypothetical protein
VLGAPRHDAPWTTSGGGRCSQCTFMCLVRSRGGLPCRHGPSREPLCRSLEQAGPVCFGSVTGPYPSAATPTRRAAAPERGGRRRAARADQARRPRAHLRSSAGPVAPGSGRPPEVGARSGVRRDGDEGDVVVGVVGEHAGGELVTFPASVNRTSRTSMEIGVRVATQDLVSQVVRHTNSGYFTVVAVGPVGDRLRSRRGSRPPPKNAVGTGPLVGVGSSGNLACHLGDPAGDDHLITTPRERARPGRAASFDYHSDLPPVPSGVVRRHSWSICMPAELRRRTFTNHPEAAADNWGQAALGASPWRSIDGRCSGGVGEDLGAMGGSAR